MNYLARYLFKIEVASFLDTFGNSFSGIFLNLSTSSLGSRDVIIIIAILMRIIEIIMVYSENSELY